jgi:hypothetical protein
MAKLIMAKLNYTKLNSAKLNHGLNIYYNFFNFIYLNIFFCFYFTWNIFQKK